MRLIFLSSLVPVKEPKSGFDIANRVIADGLMALGIDLKVMGFLTPGEQPAYPDRTIVLGELEVTNAKVSKLQKMKWLLRAYAENMNVSSAKLLQVSARSIEDQLDALRPFDGMVLNSVQMAGAFQSLIKNEKNIFIAHNVESVSAFKNADAAGSAISALLFRREAKLLAKLEDTLCVQAAHVWTLADQDRCGLNVEDKSNTLPLVTSMELPSEPNLNETKFDVGTIGSWSWAANRQGLDWFLQNVVPKLPPDYKIGIAGGIGEIPNNVPDNINFLGRVDDAHSFCRSCGVIPLFSQEGTGVQLKTIETFELGLPAVATQNALRGIHNIPSNCDRAESPTEFAEALIKNVEKVRQGADLHLDGRKFHQQQRQVLLAEISSGLRSAGFDFDAKAGAA